MIVIDGRMGEGGGQVLRTSLAFSIITGQPFRIEHIRAGRKNPGLQQQHLTCVHSAARISSAAFSGAEVGSRELVFSPGPAAGGDYDFRVGTAGSATLVLQTVLPPLLGAGRPSTLLLEGGTHNPWAPPFDFLERAFLPIVSRTGAKVSASLERRGFYPAGGGRFRVTIEPAEKPAPVSLMERGEIRRRESRALVSRLPRDIGEREIKVIQGALRINGSVLEVTDSPGPGNAVMIEVEAEHVTEVFTGFGRRGARAEAVAHEAVDEARRWLDSGAPVGEHLADQLAVVVALVGGEFRTCELSRHATTNVEVINVFLPKRVKAERIDDTRDWRISAAGT